MSASHILGGKKSRRAKLRTKLAKRRKMKKVMDEFKSGQLHSGSKHGPAVKSRAQAIAIGLSESGQSNSRKY